MNQVQEMLILNDPQRVDEGVKRLEGLFGVMRQQPGFLHAEVCRNLDEPRKLLVLHAWARLEDWQAFQASPWKIEFSAQRPAGLYEFAPIGMNWQLVSGPEAVATNDFLRRNVTRDGAVEMSAGSVAQQTARYVDDLPDYVGCSLSLTHYACTADCAAAEPTEGALVEEAYEVLLRRSVADQPVGVTTRT
jgi:heme-degrading monooxygenase HmoA